MPQIENSHSSLERIHFRITAHIYYLFRTVDTEVFLVIKQLYPFIFTEAYDISVGVYFPVYIKTYKRRNGDPSYTLMIQQDDLSCGEHF